MLKHKHRYRLGVVLLLLGWVFGGCSCQNVPTFTKEDNESVWEDTLVCQLEGYLFYRDEQYRLLKMDMSSMEKKIILDFSVAPIQETPETNMDPDHFGQQIFVAQEEIVYYTVINYLESKEQQYWPQYTLYRYDEKDGGYGRPIIDQINRQIVRIGSKLYFAIEGEIGYRIFDLITEEIAYFEDDKAPWDFNFNTEVYDVYIGESKDYTILGRNTRMDDDSWDRAIEFLDSQTGERVLEIPIDFHEDYFRISASNCFFKGNSMYLVLQKPIAEQETFEVYRYDFSNKLWYKLLTPKGYLAACEKAGGQWYMLVFEGRENDDTGTLYRYNFDDDSLNILGELLYKDINQGEFDINTLIVKGNWCFGYSIGESSVDSLGFICELGIIE